MNVVFEYNQQQLSAEGLCMLEDLNPNVVLPILSQRQEVQRAMKKQ